MSSGSRANQVNPEALIILFRATIRNRFFLRVTAGPSLRVRKCTGFFPIFHMGKSFFARLEI
jgi:hypothetical protein